MSEIIQKKKEAWEILKPKIEAEVEGKYVVEVEDLEKDGKYFHPYINMEENIKLYAQSNISENENEIPTAPYYALQIIMQKKDFEICVPIHISFKEAIQVTKKKSLVKKVKE